MTPLTGYEQLQVNAIAGWKAEPPALILEGMDAAARPIVKLAERFIPEQAVKDAIKIAYQDSEILAHREEVAKRAQVTDVHDLRYADLTTCDRLADEFVRSSASKAAVRGSMMPAGALVGMEMSIMYALKAVHTIGFCYGFTPEDRREMAFAMHTLMVASAGSLREKQRAIVNLHSLEDVFVEELVEDFIEEEMTTFIERAIEEMAGSTIPLVGLALAGATNFAMTSLTAKVAKRVFQERWLRDNQKVKTIAPDPKVARTRGAAGGSACVAAASSRPEVTLPRLQLPGLSIF